MQEALDTYLFDLQGYLRLECALTPQHVEALNQGLNRIPRLTPGQWYGHVHGHAYGETDGLNYQQIYEAGEPFEQLIDHPAWIGTVRRFIGGENTIDQLHGPLFIDENFANFRGPGEAIGLHSGGHSGSKRNQYRVVNGSFMCMQINILIALTDIGPGDGATMLIPGSHKSNFPHPQYESARMRKGASVDQVAAAVEVHLRAGDALLFTDAMAHGSAKRTTPGERRIIVYRYQPSWAVFRFGYEVSSQLAGRLTPERLQIVKPFKVLEREPNLLNPHRKG